MVKKSVALVALSVTIAVAAPYAHSARRPEARRKSAVRRSSSGMTSVTTIAW